MRSRPRYSRLSTAFLASSLLLSTPVLSQDVRQMVAPPVKGIVIDGKLDENAWKAATVTEPFLYLCTHEPA
ncbi:MAG: hypothetical protein FJ278_04335, partial [Planctomycetes bacterium]|nr:hypothetical protein [Planctomycetota bacterium]